MSSTTGVFVVIPKKPLSALLERSTSAYKFPFSDQVIERCLTLTMLNYRLIQSALPIMQATDSELLAAMRDKRLSHVIVQVLHLADATKPYDWYMRDVRNKLINRIVSKAQAVKSDALVDDICGPVDNDALPLVDGIDANFLNSLRLGD